jgi:hypothetical protein
MLLSNRVVTSFLLALLLAISIGLVAGCRTALIYDVRNAALAPPPGATLTSEDVRKAVRTAGERLGWRMEDVRPGEMVGTLTMSQRHVAVVSIDYDTSQFSIRYKDSKLLMKDGSTIHKNYNDWIMKLEAAIKQEVAQPGPSRGTRPLDHWSAGAFDPFRAPRSRTLQVSADRLAGDSM